MNEGTKNVLGLDLGTNSIGWCLMQEIHQDGKISYKLLDGGVNALTWNVKLDSKKREHPNQTRREKRLSRRLIRRRSNRKQKIRKIVKENFGIENWQEIFYASRQQPDVYELRAKALREKISPEELARIWIFFAGHRGFRSNRKEKNKDQNATKGSERVLNEKWEKLFEETRSQTLGEFLHKRLKEGGNVRRIFTDTGKKKEEEKALPKITRSLVEKEFDVIWEKQAEFHPELTEDLKKQIRQTLFFQHPIPSQKHLIAHCKWNPAKRVVAKSHPVYEEYKVYEFVANLRIDKKKLSEEQKEKVRKQLFSQKDYNSKTIAKLLNTAPEKLSHDKKISQQGAVFHSMIEKVLSKKIFKELSPENLEKLWYYLYSFDAPEKLEEKLKTFFAEIFGEGKVPEEKISKLAWEIFLPEGYGNISLSVLRKVLPYLKKGYDRHQSFLIAGVENAFKNKQEFKDREEEILDFITKELHKDKGNYMEKLEKFLEKLGVDFEPGKLYDPVKGIRRDKRKEMLLKKGAHYYIDHVTNNPVVKQILHNLYELIRQVQNKHEKIDEIRIEFPRGLRASKEERKAIEQKQKENEEKRQKVLDRLKEEGISPSKETVTRFLLWEEQKYICPYCGDNIGLSEAASASTEIDHIYPESVSLDDSFANKVLSCASCNREKGQRTPWEWKGSNAEEWKQFTTKIALIYNQSDNTKKFLKKINNLKKLYENKGSSWEEIKQEITKAHKEFFPDLQEQLKHFLEESKKVFEEKREWKKFQSLVKQIYGTENPKYYRLTSKKTKEDLQDEWLNRQLPDTAYMSRLGKEILEDIFKTPVEPIKAGIVARLRHLWGLNSLLVPTPRIPEKLRENLEYGQKIWVFFNEKKELTAIHTSGEKKIPKKNWKTKHGTSTKEDLEKAKGVFYLGEVGDNYRFLPDKQRFDHRHHFLDAVVTATTNRKHIARIYKQLQEKIEKIKKEESLRIDPPYENFRKDLAEKLQSLLVYYPSKRRSPVTKIKTLKTKKEAKAVRGALHEETFYGQINNEVFVTRKSIEDAFKERKNENKFIDKKLQQELQKVPDKNSLKEFYYPEKNSHPVRHVRIKAHHIPDEPAKENPSEDLSPKYINKTWVLTKNNHHIDIYFNPAWKINTKKYNKYEFEVVSFREAARRHRKQEPLEGKRQGEGLEHLFSLYMNDLVLLKPPTMNVTEYQQIIEDLEMFLEKSSKKELRELIREKRLPETMYRIQKINASKQIFFRHHREATTNSNREFFPLYKSAQGVKAWQNLLPVKLKLNRLGEMVSLQKGYK